MKPKRPPPIDFSVFILGLGAHAAAMLGGDSQDEDDLSARVPGSVDLTSAAQFIDTLQMLEAKTQGNLTDDETRLLQGMLYDLRMKFLEVEARAPEAAERT